MMQARLSPSPTTSNGTAAYLICNFPAQLVLDVRADNIIKACFGLESEIACTLGVEPLSPTGNDSLDKLVRRAADARGHLVTCDTA